MREFLSVSCLSLRATLKNLRRMACGLLAMLAFTLPVQAVDLLYVTTGDGTVITYDVSSGNSTTIANSKTIFASGFIGPRGLTFDAGGNLYVNDGGNGTISKITSTGVVSQFASGLNINSGLTFDSNGDLFATNNGNNTISKITPGGVVTTFASGLSGPVGLTIDAGGNFYAANLSNGSISKITSGGVVSTFASGMSMPNGLTIDSSGNLYTSNLSTARVSKITPGGVVSTFATGLTSPFGLTFDSSGNLYVAGAGSAKTISKLDSTGALLFSFSTGSTVPAFLAFGPGPTPIPEPSTYALAAIATGVMGVIARRRKARKSA